MGLNQKQRIKKRLPDREPQPLEVAAQMNHIGSFDFMSDALYGGRRFRCLNIIDEGTREALGVVPDTLLQAARVVRELGQIESVRGLPQRIRIDNGPEMLAQVFTDWREDNGIELAYIQPGKPNQNAYIERFNRSFRDELLDPYLFTTLSQVREIAATWIISYNEERPHDSLGRIPPAESRR